MSKNCGWKRKNEKRGKRNQQKYQQNKKRVGRGDYIYIEIIYRSVCILTLIIYRMCRILSNSGASVPLVR